MHQVDGLLRVAFEGLQPACHVAQGQASSQLLRLEWRQGGLWLRRLQGMQIVGAYAALRATPLKLACVAAATLQGKQGREWLVACVGI